MPQGYHHVTLDIRSQIYALKATGASLHKIANIVDHHVSTISREIKRNTGGRGYRYKQADAKAVERRSNASGTPKKLTPALVAIRIASEITSYSWAINEHPDMGIAL